MQKRVLALLMIMIVIAVMVAVTAGCGSKKVVVTDSEGNKVTVTSDDNTIDLKSDQGQLSISTGEGSAELPAGYPRDLVPIFPGAKIQTAVMMDEVISVQIYTEKSITEVCEYYAEIMKDAKELMHDQGDTFFDLEGIMGEYRVFLYGMSNEIEGKKITVMSINLEPEP